MKDSDARRELLAMRAECMQKNFDRIAISIWKNDGAKCLFACLRFLERSGYIPGADRETPLHMAIKYLLMDFKLPRVPDLSVWAFEPIGAWLFASYPSLFDEIAACEDAAKIDLSKLQFVENAKVVRPNRRPSRKEIVLNEKRAAIGAAQRSHRDGRLKMNKGTPR